MKKPTVGETDKLRALTEDPELRALMEQYYAAPAPEQRPILKTFAEKADELHPDWRETLDRAERDGRILRALFIHTLKEARARPDLTEFEQFRIKELEIEFVTPFDTFSVASPDAERAVKLALLVQEMEMIARLGFEEAIDASVTRCLREDRRAERRAAKVVVGTTSLGPRTRPSSRKLSIPNSPTSQTRMLRSKSRPDGSWRIRFLLRCARSRGSCPNCAKRESFRSERTEGPNRFRHEGGFVSDTKGASVSEIPASLSTDRCASRRKDARLVSMFYRPVPARTP